MAIDQILSALGNLPQTAATTGIKSPSMGIGSGAENGGNSFSASLERMIGAVESSSADANQSIIAMTDGTGDVHDAMIALQKADMTLQLTMQIRNKLVNAYQEIMRMPV
jgi:flagellar hook-basal body complex protein FliE